MKKHVGLLLLLSVFHFSKAQVGEYEIQETFTYIVGATWNPQSELWMFYNRNDQIVEMNDLGQVVNVISVSEEMDPVAAKLDSYSVRDIYADENGFYLLGSITDYTTLRKAPYLTYFNWSYEKGISMEIPDSLSISVNTELHIDQGTIYLFGLRYQDSSLYHLDTQSIYLLEFNVSTGETEISEAGLYGNYTQNELQKAVGGICMVFDPETKILKGIRSPYGRYGEVDNYISFEENVQLETDFGLVDFDLSKMEETYVFGSSGAESEIFSLYSNYPLEGADFPHFDPEDPIQQYFVYQYDGDMNKVSATHILDWEFSSMSSDPHFWAQRKRSVGDTLEVFKVVYGHGRRSLVTEELLEDGFLYYSYDLQTGQQLERRFISRYEALKDVFEPYEVDTDGGDYFIHNGSATISMSSRFFNDPETEHAYYTLPIEDMPLALQQLSSRQLKANLYPNPAQEYIFIEGNSRGSYQVIDMAGRQLLSGDYYGGVKLDVSELANGVYSFHLKNDEGARGVYRFVKE